MDRGNRSNDGAVLAFLDAILDVEDIAELPRVVVAVLPDIIGADVASYHEVELPLRRTIRAVTNLGAYAIGRKDDFDLFAHEHPLIGRIQSVSENKAMKITDHLSSAEYRRTGLFNEVYRPDGLIYDLSVSFLSDPSINTGISLRRASRDFSDDERDVLGQIRQRLIRVVRSLARVGFERQMHAGTIEALAQLGYGLIFLSRAGAVGPMSDEAQRLLFRYFEWRSDDQLSLPEPIKHFIALHVTRSSQNDVIRFECADGSLEILLCPAGDGYRLLLRERARLSPGTSNKAAREAGLTRRETEILGLVAQGKSNKEIAFRLGITERTVAKHLEVGFRKLRVRSRTEAVAKLFAR